MDFSPLHELAAPLSSTGSQAFAPPQLSIALWYGASLGGQKLINVTFYEFFDVTFYKYLRRLLVKTRNRK